MGFLGISEIIIQTEHRMVKNLGRGRVQDYWQQIQLKRREWGELDLWATRLLLLGHAAFKYIKQSQPNAVAIWNGKYLLVQQVHASQLEDNLTT